MFQSLTRPYFFHGSPSVCPYFLKSASMLREAASLHHVSYQCMALVAVSAAYPP
jgi:hypothetical protein